MSLQIEETLDCLLAPVGLASKDGDNVSVMNALGALLQIFHIALFTRGATCALFRRGEPEGDLKFAKELHKT